AELLAVRRMALPRAFELEQLAGGRLREGADDGDRLVATGDLGAQDRERTVGGGEHHPPGAAFERFGHGHRPHEKLIDLPRKKLRVRTRKSERATMTTTVIPRLVLASASPRRLELLRQAGLDPEVIASRIDETPRQAEEAIDYARRMSVEKAHAVAATV